MDEEVVHRALFVCRHVRSVGAYEVCVERAVNSPLSLSLKLSHISVRPRYGGEVLSHIARSCCQPRIVRLEVLVRAVTHIGPYRVDRCTEFAGWERLGRFWLLQLLLSRVILPPTWEGQVGRHVFPRVFLVRFTRARRGRSFCWGPRCCALD